MDKRYDERRGKIRIRDAIMKEEIINKVAKSGLITLNLEDYYQEGETFDEYTQELTKLSKECTFTPVTAEQRNLFEMLLSGFFNLGTYDSVCLKTTQ